MIQQKKPENRRSYINYRYQQNKLPLIKKNYPEYNWVYSKVLQMTLYKLNANFKSFHGKRKKGDKSARPPRFKGKKYFFTLCFNQSGFKANKNSIVFSHNHPSTIPLEFFFPPNYVRDPSSIKQVEINYNQFDRRWSICITSLISTPPYRDNGLYQAIDLGVMNLVSAVNSHLKFIQIKNRRADLFWKKKIKEIQSKRDHCKKFSHRWSRYHEKLRKMKRKCANQLRDYQHKVSKKVITHTKANTIIIGDLSPKRMAQKKRGTGNARITKSKKTLNHSIHNTGSLGRFSEFLTYKAEKVGKRVIRIDESYTTQKCCICNTFKKRTLQERYITCDCGNHLDRDLNSAVNIMERFLKHQHSYSFLSQQPSLTEESFNMKLDLLRQTASTPPPDGDDGLVVS